MDASSLLPPRVRSTLAPALLLALFAAGCGGGSSGSNDPATPGEVVLTDAVADPAPALNEPGAYGCDGCPSGLFDDFERSAVQSSAVFDGVIDDAVGNGEYFVRGVDGQAIGGTIPTAASGAFEFTAPLFCGVQTVKCVWSNETGRYVLVTEVTRDDCEDADIRITLNWDDLGLDYELHLIEPGGRINDDETDCTWTSCIGTGPDWGVAGDASDDPRKDVDDTGTFGPENIFLSRPVTGTYHVLVEHWGGGDPASDGTVTFNVDGRTTVAEVENLASQFVWNVGTIDWPSGEVTLDGSTVDCNDAWRGGCRLALPERTASP